MQIPWAHNDLYSMVLKFENAVFLNADFRGNFPESFFSSSFFTFISNFHFLKKRVDLEYESGPWSSIDNLPGK